jgi:hypothetical protein
MTGPGGPQTPSVFFTTPVSQNRAGWDSCPWYYSLATSAWDSGDEKSPATAAGRIAGLDRGKSEISFVHYSGVKSNSRGDCTAPARRLPLSKSARAFGPT